MLNKKVTLEVVKLAVPAVGEMMLYMVLLIFDTAMVGKYGGNTAVSAVGLSSEIIYSIVSILIDIGIAVAVTSLVARKVGEKNKTAAEEYASIGFYIGCLISFITCFITFKFSCRILIFAGAKDMVLDLGVMSLRIASLGMFFRMLSGILSGIVRGYGNTRTPLYAAGLVLVINVFLDWALIFGNLGFYEYGIRGSAVAFTLSQVLGFFYMFSYIITKSKIKIRIKYILFSLNKLKEFLELCIPTSLEDAAFNVSRLLCLFIIMYNGTTAFASNQIATTIENISFMQGHGFSVAATTLVGFKVGERNYREAKNYAYTCAFLGGSVMLICSIFFLLIPHFLINQFVSQTEKEVINFGAECLRIASIAQPFMGISLIFAGAMKGSGDTKSPFLISFITSWFIRLPLMYYFIFHLRLSVVYVWWITNIQWCLDGLLMFLMFEKKFRLPRYY